MFLKHKQTGSLIEIVDLSMLFDPFQSAVPGRFQSGEDVQDVENFAKADLVFPSNEELPRCWVDRHYRQKE